MAVFSTEETTHWVMEAAVQKAPAVRSGIWRNNCTPRAAANVHAFLRAAQHVQELLEQGRLREQI